MNVQNKNPLSKETLSTPMKYAKTMLEPHPRATSFGSGELGAVPH